MNREMQRKREYMNAEASENSPQAGLRGDSGGFMEDGFGADGMNRRQRRSDNPIQVRLLQRERMNAYALRSIL